MATSQSRITGRWADGRVCIDAILVRTVAGEFVGSIWAASSIVD